MFKQPKGLVVCELQGGPLGLLGVYPVWPGTVVPSGKAAAAVSAQAINDRSAAFRGNQFFFLFSHIAPMAAPAPVCRTSGGEAVGPAQKQRILSQQPHDECGGGSADYFPLPETVRHHTPDMEYTNWHFADCLRCPLCDGYFGRHGSGMCQQSHCRAEQTNPSGIFFGASDFENGPEKVKKLGMN